MHNQFVFVLDLVLFSVILCRAFPRTNVYDMTIFYLRFIQCILCQI